MTTTESTLVILRRARVPEDRKPRRVLPGDYFAVIVNSKACYGKLPAVASAFDDWMSPGWCEVGLLYYRHSAPARREDVPPELLAYLKAMEAEDGASPMVERKRLRYDEFQAMWER